MIAVAATMAACSGPMVQQEFQPGNTGRRTDLDPVDVEFDPRMTVIQACGGVINAITANTEQGIVRVTAALSGQGHREALCAAALARMDAAEAQRRAADVGCSPEALAGVDVKVVARRTSATSGRKTSPRFFEQKNGARL